MQSESEASLSGPEFLHARFDRKLDGSTYLIGEGGGCIIAVVTFYLTPSMYDTNGLVVC
jgi:hypothetical protein